MPNLMNRLQGFGRKAAQKFTMIFGGGTGWGRGWGSWSPLGRTRINYAAAVQDGRGNAIVVACLGWIKRKFPEAPLELRRKRADGKKDLLPDHPMVQLLRRPNRFYSGALLLTAAVIDWRLHGNGYLLKIRSGAGRVVELWYVPECFITPYWDSPQSFIDYYEYKPDGAARIELPVTEVIHFRDGIDPNNIRLGLSDMGALLREIFTDDEAANYSATVLANTGVPGIIIAPDGDTQITPENAEQAKQTFMSKFGGEHRGEPMVLSSKVKVERVSFSPAEMNLRDIRRIPEERVTAIFGIPAVVVGMGAGLDRSTFANFEEAREVAVEDNLIPCYRLFAEELQSQLLPDFESNPDQFEVYFDTSQIRELQPDEDRLVARETERLKAGGITINEFRTNTGSQPLPDGGDVLLIPISVTPTEPSALLVAPVASTPPATPSTGGKAFDILDLEIKATGTSIVRAIERFRARQLATETPRLTGFLRDQRDLAVSIVRDEAKVLVGVEEKAGDAERFASRVTARLEQRFQQGAQREVVRVHLQALTGVTDIVAGALDTPITVDEALRGHYLREAATNVRGITDVTMRQIRETLIEGSAREETADMLAARIQGLGAFSEARAELLAITEVATATNRASLVSYELSGRVEQVQVIDGTTNDEECAQMNGRVFTMQEAAGIDPIQHPRCVRQFLPILRSQRALTNGHVHKELVGV